MKIFLEIRHEQQKTPVRKEISPKAFSNLSFNPVKSTPPRNTSGSGRMRPKPTILTSGLRNASPQTSKPSTSSVLSTSISHSTIKETSSCGSINFDNREEITGKYVKIGKRKLIIFLLILFT